MEPPRVCSQRTLRMVGKPVKELDHVDLGGQLAKIGLAKIFPMDVRRSLSALRPTLFVFGCRLGRR